MNDVIDAAQAQDKFDVLSFVQGTAYPTEEVTIFRDVAAARELQKLNQERLDRDKRGEESADLDVRIAELTDSIKKSSIVFELRGMPPGVVQDLYNMSEDMTEKDMEVQENKLIAGTIVGARNAEGVRDARVFDEDAVNILRRNLQGGEFGKLVQGVINVNFNAAVFDEATDAGFLSRSADVA